MLFTISLSLVGLITVFAMIMMIGNVLTGSKYGKTWAMVAGGSLMMAGLLLVVQMFAPDAIAQGPAEKERGEQTAHAAEEQVKPAAGQPTATETAAKPEAATDAAVDASELAYLTAVLDSLKQGKPIPQEYLAMLPDGGKGIQAMQANSGVKQEETKLSEPLLQQIVAVARSQGKTVDTANSYVPTAPKAPASAPQSGAGTVATTKPAANTGTKPPATTPSAPASPPAQTPAPSKPADTTTKPAPAPTPAPPVQQPQPQPQPQPKPPTAGTLLDGGVLKSVLGKSKADVKSFFQYNQFLGETGNTLTYLRGSTVVEVTMNGDAASSVYMRFDRLNPPGREQSYYESFMMGIAGMASSEPSSRSGQDLRWNNVYPGASSIQLHVDTSSNSGYIRASR